MQMLKHMKFRCCWKQAVTAVNTCGCARLQCFNRLPVCADKYTILKICFYSHQVSLGSVVQFEKGNFSLSAETEEKVFPEKNEYLLQWAQKEYGAVTSFTELKISRNIYIKVGEGKNKTKQQQNSTNEQQHQLILLNVENKSHCSSI